MSKRETLTESMRRLSTVVDRAELLREQSFSNRLEMIFKTPEAIKKVRNFFQQFVEKGRIENPAASARAIERQVSNPQLTREQAEELREVKRRLEILSQAGQSDAMVTKFFGPQTRPKELSGLDDMQVKYGTRGNASLKTDFKHLTGRSLTVDELEFLSSVEGAELAQDLTDLGNLFDKLGSTDTVKQIGSEFENDLLTAMNKLD